MDARGPDAPREPQIAGALKAPGPKRILPIGDFLLVTVILTPALLLIALTFKHELDSASADARAARTELAAQKDRDSAQIAQVAILRRNVEETEAKVREDAEKLRTLSSSDRSLNAALESTAESVSIVRNDLRRFVEDRDSRLDGGPSEQPTEAGGAPDTAPALSNCVELVDALEQFVQAERNLVVVRRGESMVLAIPRDTLFDPSTLSVSVAGRGVLARFARVLARSRWDGSVRVDAYADGPGYQSSWEFTAAKAAQVAEVLAAQGVSKVKLSATGHGASARAGDRVPAGGLEIAASMSASDCRVTVSDAGREE